MTSDDSCTNSAVVKLRSKFIFNHILDYQLPLCTRKFAANEKNIKQNRLKMPM